MRSSLKGFLLPALIVAATQAQALDPQAWNLACAKKIQNLSDEPFNLTVTTSSIRPDIAIGLLYHTKATSSYPSQLNLVRITPGQPLPVPALDSVELLIEALDPDATVMNFHFKLESKVSNRNAFCEYMLTHDTRTIKSVVLTRDSHSGTSETNPIGRVDGVLLIGVAGGAATSSTVETKGAKS